MRRQEARLAERPIRAEYSGRPTLCNANDDVWTTAKRTDADSSVLVGSIHSPEATRSGVTWAVAWFVACAEAGALEGGRAVS